MSFPDSCSSCMAASLCRPESSLRCRSTRELICAMPRCRFICAFGSLAHWLRLRLEREREREAIRDAFALWCCSLPESLSSCWFPAAVPAPAKGLISCFRTIWSAHIAVQDACDFPSWMPCVVTDSSPTCYSTPHHRTRCFHGFGTSDYPSNHFSLSVCLFRQIRKAKEGIWPFPNKARYVRTYVFHFGLFGYIGEREGMITIKSIYDS
jgi:hypothetical protein